MGFAQCGRLNCGLNRTQQIIIETNHAFNILTAQGKLTLKPIGLTIQPGAHFRKNQIQKIDHLIDLHQGTPPLRRLHPDQFSLRELAHLDRAQPRFLVLFVDPKKRHALLRNKLVRHAFFRCSTRLRFIIPNLAGRELEPVGNPIGKQGDVDMGATVNFNAPKAPPASASAFIDENGQMTLYSPLMKRMHGGVRDVTPHDPETGEVRDV